MFRLRMHVTRAGKSGTAFKNVNKYTQLRPVFSVCRVLCVKAVGATSSGNFLVHDSALSKYERRSTTDRTNNNIKSSSKETHTAFDTCPYR